MDPYAVLKYRHHEFKTGVCHDGGEHPRWPINVIQYYLITSNDYILIMKLNLLIGI